MPMLDRTVSLACSDLPRSSANGCVIVSDTAGTLYDSTVSIGTDIVVANSGACLASNLQVQGLAANVKYRATVAYRY
jgi:hypothetical protein